MKDKDQKSLELLYESMDEEESVKTVDGPSARWNHKKTGLLHRTDGPAWTITDSKGFITAEWWYVNGKKHRLDGPAYIRRFYNSDTEDHFWYVNDESLTETQFNNHPLVKAYKLKQKMKEKGTSEEEDVMLDIFA